MQKVEVDDSLDDWPKLRRTLDSPKVSLFSFYSTRDRMLGGDIWKAQEKAPVPREELRAIWDLIEDHWEVYTYISNERYGRAYFHKGMGDADWKRFEQFLEMSDDELTARCDEWLTHEEPGYDGGEDTDEEGVEDEEDNEAEDNGGDEEND